MPVTLLADVAASITDLEKPTRVIREGAGEAVVILRRNKPTSYAVPPALYEAMLETSHTLPSPSCAWLPVPAGMRPNRSPAISTPTGRFGFLGRRMDMSGRSLCLMIW